MAADRTNGTLLLDYSTEVDRLSCGANCGIGSLMIRYRSDDALAV